VSRTCGCNWPASCSGTASPGRALDLAEDGLLYLSVGPTLYLKYAEAADRLERALSLYEAGPGPGKQH
jgi:hypothetical protein